MNDTIVAIKTDMAIEVRRVPLPWLVFDLLSWARATVDKMGEAADSASDAGQHLETVQFQDDAELLTRWLKDTTQPIVNWPDLRLRQTFGPLQVTTDNLDDYIARLLARGEAVGDSDDLAVGCLILSKERVIISSNRLVVRHCGADCKGEYLDAMAMRDYVARILGQMENRQ
jgi:hypothetical protein